MKIICLDIEAADNGEMLELAVVDFVDDTKLYHSYFKPERTRKWPISQEVHHISPAMVRDAPKFKAQRSRVQQIIDEADAVMGFAVDNDLKYLRTHGILIPQSKRIIEVQKWFWIYMGKELGFAIDAVPRLSRCAEFLNLEFNEAEDAHSAANDTGMTVKVMKSLMEKNGDCDLNEDSVNRFEMRYSAEWDRHIEDKAHGFISLIESEKGYIVRNNSQRPESASRLMIEVKSRYVAEHDIRTRFRKLEISPESGLYRLREQDISYSSFAS